MARNKQKRHFTSLAETSSALLDPVLRKRAGLNIELIENWPNLIGMELAKVTFPIKIIWQRRANQEKSFEPATLLIACDGFAAMKITHETKQIIQRINAFFGYIAIGRLKIVQKNIENIEEKKETPAILANEDKQRVENLTQTVEDEALRQSLLELGYAIFAKKVH